MATLAKPVDRIKRVSEPKMTAEEFLALPEDHPATELIHGEQWMSPPPELAHQMVSDDLNFLLRGVLSSGGRYRLLPAPVGLWIAEELVLQPDLVVVPKDHPDLRNGVKAFSGVPLLVVEVLSKSTREYDRRDKYSMYQQARIPNYWIVDPKAKSIEAFTLVDGIYEVASVYRASDTEPAILPPLSEPLDLSVIFPE